MRRVSGFAGKTNRDVRPYLTLDRLTAFSIELFSDTVIVVNFGDPYNRRLYDHGQNRFRHRHIAQSAVERPRNRLASAPGKRRARSAAGLSKACCNERNPISTANSRRKSSGSAMRPVRKRLRRWEMPCKRSIRMSWSFSAMISMSNFKTTTCRPLPSTTGSRCRW